MANQSLRSGISSKGQEPASPSQHPVATNAPQLISSIRLWLSQAGSGFRKQALAFALRFPE
jgi:hypothetical protein